MSLVTKSAAALGAALLFASAPAAFAQATTDTMATTVPADDDDGDEGKWGLLGLLGLAGLLGMKRRDRDHDRDNRTGTTTNRM